MICVKQLFLYALYKMLLVQAYLLIFKQQKNQTVFQTLGVDNFLKMKLKLLFSKDALNLSNDFYCS